MSMTYEQWNNVIRDVVNKYTRIVTKLNLPNTVMLLFRKDETRLLSIQTFSRLVKGLGLSIEIVIKDKDGNEIDAAKFEQIVKEKFGDVNKQTLATIAGVSVNKKAEKTVQKTNSTPSDDMPSVDGITENNNETKTAENSEQHLAASPEAEIDLSDIFADGK